MYAADLIFQREKDVRGLGDSKVPLLVSPRTRTHLIHRTVAVVMDVFLSEFPNTVDADGDDFIEFQMRPFGGTLWAEPIIFDFGSVSQFIEVGHWTPFRRDSVCEMNAENPGWSIFVVATFQHVFHL